MDFETDHQLSPPFFIQSALPATLRRAFKTAEYARQFIAGEIRFGLLSHYRTQEGWRQDQTEGNASLIWNLRESNPEANNVHYSGSSLNAYYALCTSHPDVCECYLKKHFGSFIVCINEPSTLLQRIRTAWKDDERAFPDAFITPVVYNKGELFEANRFFLSPPCLTYNQKPTRFSQDREYRYLLQCRVGAKEDPTITLKVPSCSDICSLVSGSSSHREFHGRSIQHNSASSATGSRTKYWATPLRNVRLR
jgi:hypothetical protein